MRPTLVRNNRRADRIGANRHGENGRNEGANGHAPDSVDRAIAADQQQVAIVTFSLQLATGRPAQISVPKDLTDFEALNLHAIVNEVRDKLRSAQGPQLVIPGPGVRVPPQPS